MNSTQLSRSPLLQSLNGGLKLVFLRPVTESAFEPRAELFAILIALNLILSFVFGLAAFGLSGELNLYELPRTLMFVPMALFAGLLTRRIDRTQDLLTLPIALAAVSVVMTVITSALYLLAQQQLLPFIETYWTTFEYVTLAWAGGIVFLAAVRLNRARAFPRVAIGVMATALVVLPNVWLPEGALWMPRYDESASSDVASFHSLADEKAFYAQQGALERELDALEPERPGVTDLYVVAAGLYAGEDVFMKEIRMIGDLAKKRFDADGRTVLLVNNPKTLDEYPIASVTSLTESLHRVGEIMNPAEDVLLLYVSSHGSDKHELVVDFRPLRFAALDPERLKAALDESHIRWKVIVLSACYSGGFIDALKDDHTLIITAARADRTSFGCGSASDSTYLARALFAQALRKTYSFERAFDEARRTIEKWESEKKYEPSEPQIYVGSEIRPKLAALERRLAARTTASR